MKDVIGRRFTQHMMSLQFQQATVKAMRQQGTECDAPAQGAAK